jgi:hypothetical protein
MSEKGQYHVYPLDDLKEHVAARDCWCDPECNEGVWVHNAADGRELYERKERKPH